MIGIKSGMVMQRNPENVCDIRIQAAAMPPFAVYHGAAEGRAPIEPVAEGAYRLRGIPTGGPYTITLGDSVFESVYVGDVWILAGQSNMEGLGHMTAEDYHFTPREDVRALYLSNQWAPAKEALHDLGDAHFKIHDLLGGCHKPVAISVGPGLSFGLTMQEYTGVPQGLICCAHGATNLAYHWDPDALPQGPDRSLYAAMVRRVEENGSHVRGMFWYQGCSDAEDQLCEAYTENMKKFVAACRRDMGEHLPIVQVQIGRTVSRPNADYRRWWDIIQERQRRMDEEIEHLLTVSAITKELDDAIHLDSPSQAALGREAAEAMYYLVFGTDRRGCLPPPQLETYWLETDALSGLALLKIRYQNLHGRLTAEGRPHGFSVLDATPGNLPQLVYKVTLEGDTAVLHLAVPEAALHGLALYYGYGPDPYCNITDAAGRSIPAMGPILL